jgi:uncharacterized membrane protein YeaQ/YmgE (transglycosylase-associated protein family)
MDLFDLLKFAIAGLIIGAIAKLLMPGRDPGGFIVTAIIGMIGALVGTFAGRFLGFGERYEAGWIMSILGAILLLAVYRMFVGRRTV